MDFHTAKLIIWLIALWGLFRLFRNGINFGGLNMFQRRQQYDPNSKFTTNNPAPPNRPPIMSMWPDDPWKRLALKSVSWLMGIAMLVVIVRAMSWLVTQVAWQMRDGSMAFITGSLSIHNQAQMQDVVSICIWIIVGLITLRIFIR